MCQQQMSYTAKVNTENIALQFSIAGYMAPIHIKASKTLIYLYLEHITLWRMKKYFSIH